MGGTAQLGNIQLSNALYDEIGNTLITPDAKVSLKRLSPDDFGGVEGALILGANAVACNQICQEHLLNCAEARKWDGGAVSGSSASNRCGNADGRRYCWCE